MRKPVRDDLFAMFPELPGLRPRRPYEEIRKIHLQVQQMRDRARLNIDRQRANAAVMQARFADRKRRGSS